MKSPIAPDLFAAIAGSAPSVRKQRRVGDDRLRRGRRRPAAPRRAPASARAHCRAWRRGTRFSARSSLPPARSRNPASGAPADRTSSIVCDARFRRPGAAFRQARRRPSCRSGRGPARAASCPAAARRSRSIDRPPVAMDERHLQQRVQIEQSGAKPVVDVVIVVGDVVGDRRDLRLQARPAVQLQVEFGIRLAQRPSRDRRPAHCAWPALPALPS